jgi:hypothetical protein
MMEIEGGSITLATTGLYAQFGMQTRIVARDVAIQANGGAMAEPGENTFEAIGWEISAALRGVYSNGASSKIDLSRDTTSITVSGGGGAIVAWAPNGSSILVSNDTLEMTGEAAGVAIFQGATAS